MVWLEKLTDSIFISLIVWVSLALLSNLFNVGGFIPAVLQAVGIFIFAKALWKWWERRPKKGVKEKAHTESQDCESLYAYMVWRRPSRVYIIRFLVGVGIVLVVAGIYAFINKVQKSRDRQKSYDYQQCINECDDARMERTQESICKRVCIGKYK